MFCFKYDTLFLMESWILDISFNCENLQNNWCGADFRRNVTLTINDPFLCCQLDDPLILFYHTCWCSVLLVLCFYEYPWRWLFIFLLRIEIEHLFLCLNKTTSLHHNKQTTVVNNSWSFSWIFRIITAIPLLAVG